MNSGVEAFLFRSSRSPDDVAWAHASERSWNAAVLSLAGRTSSTQPGRSRIMGEIMGTAVMFLDCPAYMDGQGSVRCGLPAEILCQYVVTSTDGPLESAKIRCPRSHWFNGPIEFLRRDKYPNATIGDLEHIYSHD
jgi:hypothetical protein